MRKLGYLLLSLLVTLLLVALFWPRRGEIIDGIDHRRVTGVGESWAPVPLETEIEQHPFFAPSEFSSLHNGSGNSDVNHVRGPLGPDITMHSRHGTTSPGGMIATTVFDSGGRLISFVGSFLGFEINLFSPREMELLARYDLPQRPSTFAGVVTVNMDRLMADTSGGAYFYLDDRDRVVLADADQQVVRIGHRQRDDGEWEFYETDRWDVSEHVPNDCLGPTNWFPDGECDPITSVTPDGEGRIWWVTLHGRVGTVDPETSVSRSMRFEGEEIQNTFAADGEAVYILTDHALHAMEADAEGTPTVIWRQEYDRGAARKVGNASYGSGTSPTLLGERYIIIADNASPVDSLKVYRRDREWEGDREVCSVPLFEDDSSAVELSVIAWNRSVVVANSFGYWNAFQQSEYDEAVGGIARVDIREDESGCDLVWSSDERNPSSVVRLSTSTGLLYAYTVDRDEEGDDIWYLTAMDVRDGRSVFEIPVGEGSRFDNSWAPLTLGPDGTAYIGIVPGMISLWDDAD